MVDFTYAKQKAAGIAFCFVASHFTELPFQFTCTHAIFFGKIFFRIDRFALVHHIPQMLVPHQYSVKHSAFIKLKLVLLQHRQAFTQD